MRVRACSVDRKRDKLEREVMDSQERAFWDLHRPMVRAPLSTPSPAPPRPGLHYTLQVLTFSHDLRGARTLRGEGYSYVYAYAGYSYANVLASGLACKCIRTYS